MPHQTTCATRVASTTSELRQTTLTVVAVFLCALLTACDFGLTWLNVPPPEEADSPFGEGFEVVLDSSGTRLRQTYLFDAVTRSYVLRGTEAGPANGDLRYRFRFFRIKPLTVRVATDKGHSVERFDYLAEFTGYTIGSLNPYSGVSFVAVDTNKREVRRLKPIENTSWTRPGWLKSAVTLVHCSRAADQSKCTDETLESASSTIGINRQNVIVTSPQLELFYQFLASIGERQTSENPLLSLETISVAKLSNDEITKLRASAATYASEALAGCGDLSNAQLSAAGSNSEPSAKDICAAQQSALNLIGWQNTYTYMTKIQSAGNPFAAAAAEIERRVVGLRIGNVRHFRKGACKPVASRTVECTYDAEIHFMDDRGTGPTVDWRPIPGDSSSRKQAFRLNHTSGRWELVAPLDAPWSQGQTFSATPPLDSREAQRRFRANESARDAERALSDRLQRRADGARRNFCNYVVNGGQSGGISHSGCN